MGTSKVKFHTLLTRNPETLEYCICVVVISIMTAKSRDSPVGIALGYGLDDWSSRVRSPVGAGNFFLHYRVQNGSGAHPASNRMGTMGSFPGGKAAGA
jgi:hypothetical protein